MRIAKEKMSSGNPFSGQKLGSCFHIAIDSQDDWRCQPATSFGSAMSSRLLNAAASPSRRALSPSGSSLSEKCHAARATSGLGLLAPARYMPLSHSAQQQVARHVLLARLTNQIKEGKRMNRKQFESSTQVYRAGMPLPPPVEKFKPDPTSDFPHLPAKQEWSKMLGTSQGHLQTHRRMLVHKPTIDKVIEALDLPGKRARLQDPSQGLTIVEGWAGAGAMTRSFLQQDAVSHVLSMEDNKKRFPWLTSLIQDPTLSGKGEKLTASDQSPFYWETYTNIINQGVLDNVDLIKKERESDHDYSNKVFASQEWKQESPVLFFITIPNTVHGEQLFVQLIQSITARTWLFRFCRVTLCFLCAEVMAKRCMAQPGSTKRNRISVITQSLAKPEILLDSSHFDVEKFFPSNSGIGRRWLGGNMSEISTMSINMPSGKTKTEQCLLRIEPLEEPLVSGNIADCYEYITRHLFVLRSSKISDALSRMAPGANKLLDVLRQGTHPCLKESGPIDINPDTKVNYLTVQELIAIARIFERWPFKPEILYDVGLHGTQSADVETAR